MPYRDIAYTIYYRTELDFYRFAFIEMLSRDTLEGRADFIYRVPSQHYDINMALSLILRFIIT